MNIHNKKNMKKSELRQIIREELYAELSENEQLDEISLKQGILAAFPGSEVCGYNNLDPRKSCPNFNVSKDL